MTAQEDCCFPGPTGSPLLSVEQARSAMLASVASATGAQRVPCGEALGRVLAEDIQSPIDVPPHDNSAMDGYALRASDWGDGLRLPVRQRIAAGLAPGPLEPGSAARIFTGAMIPAGADTVVMQEDCVRDGDWLQINARPRQGSHIRPRGNDLVAGQCALSAGTRLDPRHLGLLASIGQPDVPVRPRLRIALMSTGDELAEPGEPLPPGRIYNSNRPMLSALLREQGCKVIDLGRVPDTLDASLAALGEAAATADVIVTTGGVSVGEEDHVKAAVQSLGSLGLWRISMKPGKPVAFGRIGDACFAGLPGNPVSAFVTAHLFLLPVLRRMQGRSGPDFPESAYARLAQDWPRPRPRREFLRVRLVQEAAELPWAEPYARQGSDVLGGVAWADGLIEVTEDRAHARGAALRYWSFSRLQA